MKFKKGKCKVLKWVRVSLKKGLRAALTMLDMSMSTQPRKSWINVGRR